MAQGHWRRLKPGQTGEGRFGEPVEGLTWVDREETEAAAKRREKGEVPPPKFFAQRGDFVSFKGPGGDFIFVMHKSRAKRFAELTATPNWVNSKELKKFMSANEEMGLFSIFKT